MTKIHSAVPTIYEAGIRTNTHRVAFNFFKINGAFLFQLKATHGLPLDFALTLIDGKRDKGVPLINWKEYIDEARRNNRWDYQTIEEITHALEDTDFYDKTQQLTLINTIKQYVVDNPHPNLKTQST